MDSLSEQYLHVYKLDYYPWHQLSFVLRFEQSNHFSKMFWNYDVGLCAHMVQLCRRIQFKCDGTRWRTGGEVRGNWRMEWVASTQHTTSEHGVSSITNADAHTSAASSRLNWRPRRFKWTRPFRRKTKSCFWPVPSHFNLSVLKNQL